MRRLIGVILLVAALFGGGVYLLSRIDPAEAQLADDADPFGAPVTWHFPAFGLTACLALAGAGAWLVTRQGRRTRG